MLRFTIAAAFALASTPLLAGAFENFQAQPTPASAFLYIHQVVTHPRCNNCHGIIQPSGKFVPLVGDDSHVHPMGVSFDVMTGKLGMDCQTCHHKQQIFGFQTPPGTTNNLLPDIEWHMPPPEMIIGANKTPRALCEQWLDPTKNGNRGSRADLAKLKVEMIDKHMKIDPIVIWGWNPGQGRAAEPGSHAQFLRALDVWFGGGAPCPG